MRQLSQQEMGSVSGGTDSTRVIEAVVVYGSRWDGGGGGGSYSYFGSAMHWGGGSEYDYGGGLFSVEQEEAPLVMDPVIVDGATPEASPPISEENPGCNVHINPLFGQLVETCIDEDGNITQRVTPYDPELPDPGLVTDV